MSDYVPVPLTQTERWGLADLIRAGQLREAEATDPQESLSTDLVDAFQIRRLVERNEGQIRLSDRAEEALQNAADAVKWLLEVIDPGAQFSARDIRYALVFLLKPPHHFD